MCTALGQTPEEAGLTQGYPLRMITQKDILHTKSRTVADYWTLSMRPENEIVINPVGGSVSFYDTRVTLEKA